MFTGIVQTIGQISNPKEHLFRITSIQEENFLNDIKAGMSIAINGVCLTVIAHNNESFDIEVMPETLKKTNLGDLNEKDWVNLEKAMGINDRFEGHIVQGHVDGTGIITNIETEENAHIYTIQFPNNLGKYMVPKGSIALNGISLTMIDVKENTFTIGIIPHTWKVTMLQHTKPKDRVNLEVDIMSKYVEKLFQKNEK